MNFFKTMLASSAVVLAAGAASAATDNWVSNGTTCLVGDLSPAAADCVGFFDVKNDSTDTSEDAGKEGFVDVNSDMFDGVTGLFGQTDWEFYTKIDGSTVADGDTAYFNLSSDLADMFGQIAIGFKQGGANPGSEWAGYLYNSPFPEIASYTLARFTNTGLSHMTIWGRGEPVKCNEGDPGCGDPSTIPLPAAGWLLLGGLGGLAAVRRRNKV